MSLSALLVSDDKSKTQEIKELIAGESSLNLIDTVPSGQARKKIASSLPQLVWIEVHVTPVRGLSLLAELREAFPDISFLISYHNPDPEIIRTAYRLGASDFLDAQTWRTDLAASIKRIESRRESQCTPHAKITVSAASSEESGPLLTLLVCDAGEQRRKSIEALIKTQKSLTLAATVPSSQAREKVQLLQPKLIWLELGPDTEHTLSLLAELKENFPQIYIFVSYDVPDPALIRASYRLGAFDFLDAQRWKTDLPAAVQSVQLQTNPKSSLSGVQQSLLPVPGVVTLGRILVFLAALVALWQSLLHLLHKSGQLP